MRLTASNGGPARDDRRRRAEATARAAHLRLLLISEERFPRARAVLESDDGLAAAVLGLIESRLLTVHPTDRAEVEQVLLSLAFRLGAELRCCSGSEGRLLVYDDLLIRRVLAARGSGLAGAPTRTLEQALLGYAMEPPQQGVLDQGRTLLGGRAPQISADPGAAPRPEPGAGVLNLRRARPRADLPGRAPRDDRGPRAPRRPRGRPR